jgi:hypothetical protein
MSQRTSTTDSVASTLSERDTPGISLVPPESSSQLTLDTPTVRDVGPRFTEWLPDVHEALIPAISRAARELAFQYDPRILNDRRPRLFAHECLHRKHGVGTSPDTDTPTHPFNDALAKFAISYYDVDPDDLSDRKRQLYHYARDEILQAGTRDLPGAPTGLDALRETTIPLLDAANSTPSLVISFDDTAWMDVNDKRTAARALNALSVLGEAVDIRLVLSPSLDAHLERAHPDWYDDYLTGARDEHRDPVPTEASENALSSAWGVVGGFTPNGGRLRLLAALDPDGEREVRDLKADAEIDLSNGAIDRYVRELADKHDLATIDDRPKYNRISLTETGLAAQTLISPEYGIIHPAQARLDGHLTGTPHDSTSVVCRADREDGPPQPTGGGGSGGGAGGASAASSLSSSRSSTQDSSSRSSRSLSNAPRTAEDWLADTGVPSENGYSQWLDGPDGRLDAWEMHERLLAGRRVEGVTLVDEPIKAFDDGRATYETCFNDEAQVVVQWGGPLCTLVRVTSALLSEDMWSKVLTPSAIGGKLEELYDGSLDDAIQDVLRLGAQVGWFGEEQRDYDGLRDRLGEIRRLILSKLPKATASSSDEWGELCRDAHGLLASATHLYRAAGVDVTIQLRVPDTQKLRKGDERYGKFLDFFKHTVPKNAAYGVHSVYRLLHEKRVDKLKHRMGVEYGDEPSADLTASWVVSGPTATTFRDDVEQAIASKADDVREQIQDGNEQGVSLSIPVVEGNGHGALRRVIERIADRKGFSDTSTQTLRQLSRLSAATLGEQPGRCSPYALAEALLKIAKARSPNASLSSSDVAAGLATLPAERLLPELPPTMQRVFKTLVASDRPLGRSTIIERAGISENSYGRNLDEIAARDLVDAVGNGGHKKWNGWILPWWSPFGDLEAPRTADADENSLMLPSRADDVLYQAALDLGLDPEYDLFATPVDVDAVFAALPDLDRWRGFILAHYDLDSSETPPDRAHHSPKTPPTPDHTAEIGSPPTGRDHKQASLT